MLWWLWLKIFGTWCFSHSSGRTQPSLAFDDPWGQPTTVPAPLLHPTYPGTTSTVQQPSCRALYDFDAENPAELSFKENEVIFLKSQIDDDWFEGSIHGQTGFFPVSYVTVLVPLHKCWWMFLTTLTGIATPLVAKLDVTEAGSFVRFSLELIVPSLMAFTQPCLKEDIISFLVK